MDWTYSVGKLPWLPSYSPYIHPIDVVDSIRVCTTSGLYLPSSTPSLGIILITAPPGKDNSDASFVK